MRNAYAFLSRAVCGAVQAQRAVFCWTPALMRRQTWRAMTVAAARWCAGTPALVAGRHGGRPPSLPRGDVLDLLYVLADAGHEVLGEQVLVVKYVPQVLKQLQLLQRLQLRAKRKDEGSCRLIGDKQGSTLSW